MKSQKNNMTMSITTVLSCQPYLHMTEKVSDESGKEKQMWWVMKVRETGAMMMKFMIEMNYGIKATDYCQHDQQM